MIVEKVAWVTHQLMSFSFPELLLMIFVEKSGGGFKFRFSRIKGHPNLRPFASKWIVGGVALVIYLFSTPIFEFFLDETIKSWLISLGLLKISILTLSLIGFTLIFIVNYLFEREIDRITAIVGLITIASFLSFLQLKFNIIDRFIS